VLYYILFNLMDREAEEINYLIWFDLIHWQYSINAVNRIQYSVKDHENPIHSFHTFILDFLTETNLLCEICLRNISLKKNIGEIVRAESLTTRKFYYLRLLFVEFVAIGETALARLPGGLDGIYYSSV
jgi:hypothetical protein